MLLPVALLSGSRPLKMAVLQHSEPDILYRKSVVILLNTDRPKLFHLYVRASADV